MTTNTKLARMPDRQPLDARVESMMDRLLVLMEDFSVIGRNDDAGAHIHALMTIAYGAATQGINSTACSLPRTPASKSVARRASERRGS